MSMELTTDRCHIRNMKITDVDDLYQVYSDELVMMYMEPVFDMQRTKEFIQEAGLCEPPLVYAIVWNITGRVIGHVIFHSYEKNDYEIGWILNKDYWGMGIADEVTKALINYARHLGVESCVIECDTKQSVSKNIAIKNRFLYERKEDNLERYRLVLDER